MTPAGTRYREAVSAAAAIDLSRYRLNALPDEGSDEDWDDDRELFDPDGNRVRFGSPVGQR